MDDRKRQILLAIIQDYVATAEPVGSRTIARKYKLGVSPATIRNEMADLEEMGFIEQPHTSAGRIPSDQGYRYYVDYLMQRQVLSQDEEKIIRVGYESKVKEIGEVIQLTGQMLSQLTHYTAIVSSPQLGQSVVKHIQLVLMAPTQVLVIVVQDTGAVHHQMIQVSENITQGDLEQISIVLNAKLQGRNMDNIRLTLIKEIYFELSKHKQILDLALDIMNSKLTGEEKIYLGGVFNILNQPEFHNVDKIKTILSLLEQEALLRDILNSDALTEGITVRIGEENSREEIKNCSMITATYKISDKVLGTVGVIGPTRMEYAKVVSIMEYMTKNLSDVLIKLLLGNRP